MDIFKIANKIANTSYGYHVTYYANLNSIDKHGLGPGSGPSLGKGGYSGHSTGRLFFTEKSGLFFWFGRMEEHAENMSDNPLEDGLVPVVLRFPIPEKMETDELGTSDALSKSYFTIDKIVDDIEIWYDNSWKDIDSWGNIDPGVSFDIEEENGDQIVYFKDIQQNPLYPK
jgi:hypothetical protein